MIALVRWLLPLLPLLALTGPAQAGSAGERELRKEVIVAAPAAEVWAAWATSAGAQTFFAPSARIELSRGGAYEILFAPDAPRGQRGAEGLHVLSYVPGQMISFEWSAPPDFPEIRERGASTFVVVHITRLGPRRARVVLHHLGWGKGSDWDAMHAYFDRAWDVVLGRLQKRFAEGRALDFSKM